jgi:hypothetical protein
MANFRLASTRKRGPQPSNLSVRLFLLDPENRIAKVTKQTCSKDSIPQLMQKGYGPPQPGKLRMKVMKRRDRLICQPEQLFADCRHPVVSRK